MGMVSDLGVENRRSGRLVLVTMVGVWIICILLGLRREIWRIRSWVLSVVEVDPKPRLLSFNV
jgi:hypothetical protein